MCAEVSAEGFCAEARSTRGRQVRQTIGARVHVQVHAGLNGWLYYSTYYYYLLVLLLVAAASSSQDSCWPTDDAPTSTSQEEGIASADETVQRHH